MLGLLQPMSTSASACAAVGTPRKSTPSGKPSPRASYVLHGTQKRSIPPSNMICNAGRLVPKVHRRAQQEPAQARPDHLRPHSARCRQPPVRAQEVWWSWRPLQVPEVLPLSGTRRKSVGEQGARRRGQGWLVFRDYHALLVSGHGQRLSGSMDAGCGGFRPHRFIKRAAGFLEASLRLSIASGRGVLLFCFVVGPGVKRGLL